MSEWIDVDEKLPPMGQKSIVFVNFDRGWIAFGARVVRNNAEEWLLETTDGLERWDRYDEITHWMPMPTPPFTCKNPVPMTGNVHGHQMFCENCAQLLSDHKLTKRS